MTSSLSPAESRLLDHLDEDALIRSLVELVRVPSVTGTAAESEAQHLLARWYDEAGLDVDLWSEDLEELYAAPGFPGTEAPRDEAWGLVGTSQGSGPPALVLQGHVDVVPVGDLWSWAHDPFVAAVEDGRLHGRGSCDMKAGVAVNVAVARALHRSGLRTERPLALHAVVGEEDGGLGAFATLRRGHGGEAVVITEPTGGRLLTANAGALTFRLEVPGRATHGSTRLEGQSALEAFMVVHEAIRELEAARNAQPDPLFDGNPLPYAITIGTVHAGDWASSVPDLLVAEGRLGVALGESTRVAAADFERAVADVAGSHPWLKEHPPRVSWPGGRFASGRLPHGHPLADEVADAVESVGAGRPATGAAPYGSDLRLYAGDGIPTLQYGPGDIRLAHSTRESVALDEVLEVARSLAVLTARRLGAH